MLEVAGPQARLDVADAHAAVKRGQRGSHRGRRVALHQEPVGLLARQDRIQVREDAGGELARRLVRPHQVQVDVGCDLEEREDLVEHLAVLCGRAHDDARSALFAQPVDDRSHLDGLGARADDDEQLHVNMGPPGCGAAAGAARGGRA